MHNPGTVGWLKELLEEFDDNTQIMAVHQPNWPLRENVRGLWMDDGSSEEDDSCPECGRMAMSKPFESNDNEWLRRCEFKECGYEEAVEAPENILYLVVDGCPYELNPYGNKRAFDEVMR